MNIFSKCFSTYVAISVLAYTINSYSKNIVVKEIDCGTLNVGQTKYVTIPIVNTESNPLIVEKVSACCGNPKPTINMMTIPPGHNAELVQKINKDKPGHFVITSRVHFVKPSEQFLLFKIEGLVEQPIAASITWAGMLPKRVDYHKDNRLEQVGRKPPDLILCLSANQDYIDLESSLSSIKSKYFSPEYFFCEYSKTSNDGYLQLLDKQKSCVSEATPEGASKQFIGQKTNTFDDSLPTSTNILSLRLKPNGSLPIGELSDKIVVVFKDGSGCHVPIIFRSVGDVYGEYSSIGIGRIPLSGVVNKTFKIHFDDGVKPWTQVKWEAEGELSTAVSVSPSNEKKPENIHILTIKIDGSFLPVSKKGFMYSKINFFEHEPNDSDAIKLLIYGYK